MSDRYNSQEDIDDAIAALRDKARQKDDGALASQKEFVAPKEMKGRRSAWVIRGLIALLALIVVAESFIIIGNRDKIELMKYTGGPPVETYVEPVDAPLPTPIDTSEPSLEPPPGEPLLEEAPEPDPIPLPDGVEEIPFPNDES